MRTWQLAAITLSAAFFTGCASTPHQTAHRAIDDATSELAVYQAAGQFAGSIGSGAVAGLGLLNHIFKPSVDAGSTCVNGLGQPVDCTTKEPLEKDIKEKQ